MTFDCFQFNNEVLSFSRSGSILQLKELLEQHERFREGRSKDLVNFRLNGTTPLISASREGHLKMVEFLLEDCGADLKLCGSVEFDNETIEDAPPLWCAAAAGHLQVVKCLIEHGADTNCRTQTNSTPMRAACFDGHLKIVDYLIQHNADIEIANRHDHTSLMIACYKGHLDIVKKLLSVGAKVNRQSSKKNTALHDCAENGSIEIAKMLLDYGAVMQEDVNHITPIITSALAGHVKLVKFFSKECGAKKVVSINEQISSMELLGSTYLDAKQNISSACMFWEKAIELRRKLKCPLKQDTPSGSIYSQLKEPTTIDELREIVLDVHKMRMLSLMVRERILGPTHPDTTYFIRYRGAVYADSGNFDKCIELWLYALKLQQNNMEPLYHLTLSSLMSFCELFHHLLTRRSEDDSYYKLDYNLILQLLKHSIDEILRKSSSLQQSKDQSSSVTSSPTSLLPTSPPPATSPSPPSGDNATSTDQDATKTSVANTSGRPNQRNDLIWQRMCRVMVVTLHLVGLSIQWQEWEKKINKKQQSGQITTDPQRCTKRSSLLYLVRHVKDHDGRNLLHLASCSTTGEANSRQSWTRYPHDHIIQALIHARFDPNSRDKNGQTPLHLCAQAFSKRQKEVVMKSFCDLLDGGSHIDYKDNFDKSPLDYLKKQKVAINPLRYQKLSCIASKMVANTVQQNPSLNEPYRQKLGINFDTMMKH